MRSAPRGAELIGGIIMETVMKFVMKKLLAAVLILGLAAGPYAPLGGHAAEAMGPPNPPG